MQSKIIALNHPHTLYNVINVLPNQPLSHQFDVDIRWVFVIELNPCVCIHAEREKGE